MKVREFAEKLSMKTVAGLDGLDNEIKGVYICDLLSYVMSHLKKDELWVTVQTNINTVAIAVLTEAACIVIPEDIAPDEATVHRANNEGIPLLTTALTAYEIAVKAGELIK